MARRIKPPTAETELDEVELRRQLDGLFRIRACDPPMTADDPFAVAQRDARKLAERLERKGTPTAEILARCRALIDDRGPWWV